MTTDVTDHGFSFYRATLC